MRERKRGHRRFKRAAPSFARIEMSRQTPPSVRREIARNGDREAIQRRSEIDRSSGLGKPRGGPCDEGDHVATFVTTPHHRTTRWHSLPRDRRGAWAGGRNRPASGRDMAPAPCAHRRHDRGAAPCDRRAAGRPRMPCFHARRVQCVRACRRGDVYRKRKTLDFRPTFISTC